MKKLKRLEFSQLEERMPCFEADDLRTVIGGGNGSYGSPFTEEEMDAMMDYGTWDGGYVEGMGYVMGGVTIFGHSDPNGNLYGIYSTPYDYGTNSHNSAVNQFIEHWMPDCVVGYRNAVTNHLVLEMYKNGVPADRPIYVDGQAGSGTNNFCTVTIYDGVTGSKITSYDMTLTGQAAWNLTGQL